MIEKTDTVETSVRKKGRGFLADVFIRLVKEKPLGTLGGIIVLILGITGIFADVLAPFPFDEIDLSLRLIPPSSVHILGTDHLGRDILSRIIFGARISMLVGLAGSGLSVALATVIGLISGFFGGKTDIYSQRFVDAFMCIPSLFFFLMIMAIVGPGLFQVILVLGLFDGIRSSRVVRGAVISIKENVYVNAAEAIGASPFRILWRHILPNVTAPIIVIFTLSIGTMIIFEATLSFLGFGVPPPIPSWGSMLSESGRRYMLLAPHLALWPGVALAIAVYGINMLGDALRDIFDPRLKGGLGRYGGVKMKRPGTDT